jgi:uncharacterized protein YdcH (DUF465 family)
MEKYNEELKAHLMETNEEFRRLAQEHSEYAHQIEALESRSHLTEKEQIEQVRLKKLNLYTKDLMLQIMNRHRTQVV